MCNLNIVIKTQELNVTGFMQSVTTNSFEKNTDGDGFWCDKGSLIKSESKVDLTNYTSELNKSNFIISHQRWATHGKVADMVQPFENDEFVFAHNGILSTFYEYTDATKSDSYKFICRFMDELNERRTLTRDEGIVESLKILLDGVSGSYSIVLFDKITNCMYYFKNSGTTIHGFHTKGYKRKLYGIY
jgi:glucosamine 6-phosphate synthetase-like amidotransferase/phosphosugar isomerase protein